MGKNAFLCTLKAKRRMSVTIKQVLEALEQFAPLPLQESWDNAGLQIGLTEAEVSGALLCLDVTEKVIDEAVGKGCNLVVSHHPLLFRGLKQVSGRTDVERAVVKAIKNDVAVISMHTNMDNALGGVNWKMAERLVGTEMATAKPASAGEPLTKAPASASEGKMAPASASIRAMGVAPKESQWVMATLPEPLEARAFVALVKERFDVACAHCNELLLRPIRRVAICGGAGDFVLDEAIAAGADAFITGEMHYHQYFGHEQQIQICVIGHYESEQYTAEVFRDIIARACPGLRCYIAETRTNPVRCF